MLNRDQYNRPSINIIIKIPLIQNFILKDNVHILENTVKNLELEITQLNFQLNSQNKIIQELTQFKYQLKEQESKLKE